MGTVLGGRARAYGRVTVVLAINPVLTELQLGGTARAINSSGWSPGMTRTMAALPLICMGAAPSTCIVAGYPKPLRQEARLFGSVSAPKSRFLPTRAVKSPADIGIRGEAVMRFADVGPDDALFPDVTSSLLPTTMAANAAIAPRTAANIFLGGRVGRAEWVGAVSEEGTTMCTGLAIELSRSPAESTRPVCRVFRSGCRRG